jgi:hypothetical protein
MEWWKDWWEKRKPCHLASEAECVALKLAAARSRLQRETECKDKSTGEKYENAAVRDIATCVRNGWPLCEIGGIDSSQWSSPIVSEHAREKLLAELRGKGYNCKKGNVTYYDGWGDYLIVNDGIECNLSTPLSLQESSSE